MRVLGVALSLVLVGCGADDATSDGGRDTGIDATPDAGPRSLCFRTDLLEPCCAQRSNADRLDRAQLYVTAFDFDSPAGLNQTVILLPLIEAVQGGRMGWLVELDEGDRSILLGPGFQTETAEEVFFEWAGDAPDPPVDRWQRHALAAEIVGDTVRTTETAPSVTFPMIGLSDLDVALEMQVRELGLELSLTEMRTCSGEPTAFPLMWSFGGSRMTGFVTVASTIGQFSPGVATELCEGLAGAPCDTMQSEWPRQPTAFCDDASCTDGVCDPAADCNAYRLDAAIGMAGADVR